MYVPSVAGTKLSRPRSLARSPPSFRHARPSRRAIAGKGGERTFIELCIDYSRENAPLGKDLYAEDVGSSALFLCSDLARSVTGVTLYVDNGLHAMGMAVDSSALAGGLPVPKADA